MRSPSVVANGSANVEGAFTVVISAGQVEVFFEETVKVLQAFGRRNPVIVLLMEVVNSMVQFI